MLDTESSASESIAALSNKLAYVDGAHPVNVIFDRVAVSADGLVQANKSSATFAVADYPAPGPRIGDVLVIDTYDYVIADWDVGSDDDIKTALLDKR